MTAKEAFLQFKAGPTGPFQTIQVPIKDAPMWQHEKGRQFTASGYGVKIPSRYMVKWSGKWRRVYICQISNAGTAYIGKPGEWIATVDLW